MNPKVNIIVADKTKVTAKYNQLKLSIKTYGNFDLIDGTHPYKDLGPHGFVEYTTYKIKNGKVLYFNFELAKEMGLIEYNHHHKLNFELERKILDTFNIQILNEYDILTKKRISKTQIKSHKYMATRYLQLQHSNKKGVTSGDGRSVWNGTITHNNVTWDVSSRGTGVTKLAPGSALSSKPLQTGNSQVGYGCGQAELDELIGSAIMSEILHKKNVKTERVLCIIDDGYGVGIGVRAAPNLLRPAHAFLYLKQSKVLELKKVIDYHIIKQASQKNNNGKNLFSSNVSSKQYEQFLINFCKDFAHFSAQLIENYLFVWLDWDGDNVLMTAGIIDYGSVRQFGICHNQYRYDDVQRFSTNLLEQKNKAKLIVLEMAQSIDYIKTGIKKSLSAYKNHEIGRLFDEKFKFYSLLFFGQKLGLNGSALKIKLRIPSFRNHFIKFYNLFRHFENLKISKGKTKVPDGINYFPLLNMRTFSRDLPKYYKTRAISNLTMSDFIQMLLSKYSKSKDEKIFIKKYKLFKILLRMHLKTLKIFSVFKNEKNYNKFLSSLNTIHPENFLTGNALIHSVEDILQLYQKNEDTQLVQSAITKLIAYVSKNSSPKNLSLFEKKLWDKLVMNLHEYNEEI